MTINRRVYDIEAFKYVAKMAGTVTTTWNSDKKNYIEDYANKLGVSAMAIAGALAEEADSYYTEGVIKGFLDKAFDEDAVGKSHEQLESDYEFIMANGMIDEKNKVNTARHVTMRDVGPCNIRIAVAIKAIHQYFDEYPDNPLELSEEYLTNYKLLVNDLANVEGSKLTVAIAALELKKAQEYFETYVDADYWAILPQETKDAIIITAYNNGLPKIEVRRLEAIKAFGSFKPLPGGGESGGLDHEKNAERLAVMIDQQNYGNCFTFNLIEMGQDAVVKKAMQNNEEGEAYRYALLNLNRGAVIGINYNINENEYSEKYWQDRFNMLLSLDIYASSDRNDRVASKPYGIPFGTWGDYYFLDMASNVDITFNGTDLGIADTHRVIFGTEGLDTLIGGVGDDRLYGGNGDDVLIGDEGYNRLEGGRGKDSYHIKDDGEADTIYDIDQDGDIYIDGVNVSGVFTSRLGSPAYYSTDDKYRINILSDGRCELSVGKIVNQEMKYDVVAYIENWNNGGLGLSIVEGEDTELRYVLEYPNSIAYLNFDASNAPAGTILTGGIKSSSFTGSKYNDVITTGEGTLQYVSAGWGNDYVFGSNGKELIRLGYNTYSDNNDDDYAMGYGGSDVIIGGTGNDVIFGSDVNDHLFGIGIDERGDWLNGEKGSDTLYGSSGKDVIFGGAEDDYIYGGAGDDLILGDADYSPFSSLGDLQEVAGGGTQSFAWKNESGGFVKVPYYSAPVLLPNGNVFNWDWVVTEAGDFQLIPQVGLLKEERVALNGANDYLDGGAGNDWMAGQVGDDILYGGDGDDTIYGDDIVALPWGYEDGNDQLFAGKGKDLLYGGGGNDLLDATDDDNDQDLLYGGAGNDTLKGGTGQDRLYGEAGNDTLYAGSDGSYLDGGEDHDVLYGGIGNDELIGGTGNDKLVGSQGVDTLTGGTGSDTFVFSLDYLQQNNNISTITDASSEDTLYILGSFISDLEFIRLSETQWVDTSYQLLLNWNNGLTIQAFSDQQMWNSKIVIQNFENGVLGLTLDTTDPDYNHAPQAVGDMDEIQIRKGRSFSYTLPEGCFVDPDEGDILFYNITLADGSPLPDWLTFDWKTNTLSGTPTVAGMLSFKVIAIDLGGLTAEHIFNLNVLNIAIENHAPEVNRALPPKQYINEGDELTYTIPNNAFIDPDGDIITYTATYNKGALPSWLSFDTATGTFSGTPPAGDAGRYTITVTATDPHGSTASQDFTLTVMRQQDIIGTTGNDSLQGAHQYDVAYYMEGGDGNDTISGGFGCDTIRGGKGNDLLDGSYGDDIYLFGRGDGQDTIAQYDQDRGRLDTLRLIDINEDEITLSRQGNNLIISINNSTDSVTVRNHFLDNDKGEMPRRIDVIEFADGTSWNLDKINEILTGVQNQAPQINNLLPTAKQLVKEGDEFNFAIPANAFVDPDGDILSYRATLNGGELPSWLSLDTSTGIFTGTPPTGASGLFNIKVTAIDPHGANASQNFTLVVIREETMLGTAGNDSLQGVHQYDVAYYMDGGDGNDTISGGFADDTIRGGLGNDLLDGSYGNDTYLFGRGDGQDTIAQYDQDAGRTDTLRFIDINEDQVTLSRQGNNLIVSINNSTDSVTVRNHFLDNDKGEMPRRIDVIEFADGTKWNLDKINQILQINSTNSTNNLATMASLNQQLDGLIDAMATTFVASCDSSNSLSNEQFHNDWMLAVNVG